MILIKIFKISLKRKKLKKYTRQRKNLVKFLILIEFNRLDIKLEESVILRKRQNADQRLIMENLKNKEIFIED